MGFFICGVMFGNFAPGLPTRWRNQWWNPRFVGMSSSPASCMPHALQQLFRLWGCLSYAGKPYASETLDLVTKCIPRSPISMGACQWIVTVVAALVVLEELCTLDKPSSSKPGSAAPYICALGLHSVFVRFLVIHATPLEAARLVTCLATAGLHLGLVRFLLEVVAAGHNHRQLRPQAE
jgi:hypothetical protein